MNPYHSETGQMIAETTQKLLQPYCSPDQLRSHAGGYCAPAWQELVDNGLTAALEPPGKGSLDIPVADALHILRIAGSYAAPVPLAENLMANWLLLEAGIAAPAGPLTPAPVNREDTMVLAQTDSGWSLQGAAARVPWARLAAAVVVIAPCRGEDHIALVPAAACTIEHGENIAGEPRDRISIDTQLPAASVRPYAPGYDNAYALGAAIRTVQMAGALEAVLRLSTTYVQERKQFGRPIGKFQAVQQNLAVMAGQVAAARTAANSVAASLTNPGRPYNIAAAKLRANEAATIASRLAHQVHGAMGFTQEYALHFLTRRLWSWRDEFGSEVVWGRYLGREVMQRGADSLWDFITGDMG